MWYITCKIYPPGNGDCLSQTIPTWNSTTDKRLVANLRPIEKGRRIPEAFIVGQSHYHPFFLSSGGARVRQDMAQCTPSLPLEKKSPLSHHPSCCRSGVWETITHGLNGTSPCILSIKCGWNLSYGWSGAALKPQCKSGVIVRDTTENLTENFYRDLSSLCRSLVSKVLGSCHFFEQSIA